MDDVGEQISCFHSSTNPFPHDFLPLSDMGIDFIVELKTDCLIESQMGTWKGLQTEKHG